MRKNLEPLKYSTLTPTRFTVYLHPAEYARIERIIPILEEQTVRALADELHRLNRRSPMQQWFKRLSARPRASRSTMPAPSGWSSSAPIPTAT